MLSYTGIHYLRRIAVHLALGKSTPAPGNRETYQNVALNEEYFEKFNAGKDTKYQHLVVHSDATASRCGGCGAGDDPRLSAQTI
jgi:hypothetical protein